MSDVFHPSDLLTIALLVGLEGVLSADNAMVLAMLVLGLPKSEQQKALRYGIVGAFLFRGAATLAAAYLIQLGWVKLAGAAYLVFLGVQAFRHRKELSGSAITVQADSPARGDLRTVLDGVLVGVTNPKGVVFFAAVLPQFVDHSAGQLPLQMLALGLIPISIGLVTDTLWGLTASAARTWFARSDRRLSLIGGAGGCAMIGLGLTVAVTGRD